MNNDRYDHGSDLTTLDPIAEEGFAGLVGTAGAQELFSQILASEVEDAPVRAATRGRRRGRWVALGAAATLAIGLALVVPESFRPDAALARPIDFRQKDGYISAIITDPRASKQELEAAFAKHGFSIEVKLEPTSPGLAGTVLGMTEDPDAQRHEITRIFGSGCYTDGGGPMCPIGLRIPLNFTGHAVVDIGRIAQDGELYSANPNPFNPGEMLYCSGLPGKTVAEAQPILEELGVEAVWRSSDRSIDDVQGIAASLIADQFVGIDGASIANGKTDVWVSPTNRYPNGEDCEG